MADFEASWIQQVPAADVKVRGGVIVRGAARADRQPIHLIFLIDRSGSMAGQRLTNVKRSLQFLLQLMNSNDLLSLITYDDDAQTILDRVRVTPEEKASISYKIDQIREAGMTNMSAALLRARQQLQPPVVAAAAAAAPLVYKEGIIFLTDGHANRGVADKAGILNIVERTIAENPGLSISSVAYGEDHNVDLLSAMGSSGGGSYNIVNTLEHVATVFGNVLGGLASVTAQNMVIHLPPGATPLTQYATTKREDGTIDVRIGDIYSEVELTVLFEGAPATVPEIRVTFDAIQTLDHIERSVAVQQLTGGAAPVVAPKTLELAVYRYEVSCILLDMANYRSLGGVVGPLKARAEGLLTTLKSLPYAEENLVQMMIEDLERILETADHVEAGGDLTADITTAMAQHGGYLALGRGERSVMPELHAAAGSPVLNLAGLRRFPAGGGGGPATPTATSDSDDEGTPPPAGAAPLAPPAPMSRTRTARVDYENSPFHNRLQATASQAMRVSSTQNSTN